MVKVFVNGISAKSGGGRSILTNFLKVASAAEDAYQYVVAVPDATTYRGFEDDRIKILPMPRQSRTVHIPLASVTSLPDCANAYGCDIIFNLSDIPIRTRLPQVFLFDWPYAAFPDSPAWHLSTLRERLLRHTKLYLFRRFLPFVDVMIAQNNVLADCLERHYGLKNISVVPNAVSIDNIASNNTHDFGLGEGTKLLCLSRYYSHKNIEIFLPLAEQIRNEGANIKIITTVAREDGQGAATFLENVVSRGLSNIIVNLGTIPMELVPSLYHQTNALLLPTLLESFSGTYVEAMFHKRPILTSDLPFAHGVCGSSAYYFDPADPQDIFKSISKMLTNQVDRKGKVSMAKDMLDEMPNWEQAYTAFTAIFEKVLFRTKRE